MSHILSGGIQPRPPSLFLQAHDRAFSYMATTSQEATNGESLSMVVADDDPDNRKVLLRLLQRLGHSVIGEASDGLELIELCRLQTPDLVLADIVMPSMDGIEAADKIYRHR